MPELANLDQALKQILADCGFPIPNPKIMEVARKAYALAEGKNELGRMLGEPPLRGLEETKVLTVHPWDGMVDGEGWALTLLQASKPPKK